MSNKYLTEDYMKEMAKFVIELDKKPTEVTREISSLPNHQILKTIAPNFSS